MSDCPNESELLGFLDRELGAEADARLVAHIEDCAGCQARLERLTQQGSLIETVRTDPETMADLPSTEILAGGCRGADAPGESGERSIRDAGRLGRSVGGIPEEDVTSDFISATTAGRTGETEEAPGNGESETDDPDRTATATAGQLQPHPVGRSRAPGNRPAITGYDILERLGEGGMGVVYKARHRGLNRLVALKMIRGGTQARADHLSRFRIEAEAVARLHHPNILQIYDIGESGGLPFVALELLDGGSLDDRLAGTPQPGRQAAELLVTLARAVQVAHDAGIVHRDLKPSNVLYTTDGVLKVTDFGLAKRIDSDDGQTQSGQIMGSPSYMAPEQARGKSRDVGPAADVYALGAILYDMLTGRPPFKGETPMETVRQVIDDDPVPPSRLVPRVARDLETICLKSLHKEPARRYESARALAEDLARYLGGEPIKARRTPFWERGQKWVKRRPFAASLLAVISVASVLLSGWLVERVRTRQAVHDRAQTLRIEALTLEKKGDAARTGNAIAEVQAELSDLKIKLSPLLGQIRGSEDERPIQDLYTQIEEQEKALGRRRAALESEQAQLQARLERDQEVRRRLDRFRNLRNQVQFAAIRMGEITPEDHRKALGTSTITALGVYAEDPQAPVIAWSLIHPLSDALGSAEKTEVTEGCYELLLTLAEAVDPADGLKVLDCAARLRPVSTPAYHLCRAACLARVPDAAGRAREEDLASRRKPDTALDFFLDGRERLERGRLGEAVKSLEEAIRRDPNQLGAHLLLAAISFTDRRYGEAASSLHNCIRAAPDLAGLYLFRGLVYGQEGSRALAAARQAPERRVEAAYYFAAAEDDYRQALNRNPGPEFRYRVLINRGGMYFQSGRLDQAATDFEAAIEIDPKPYHPYGLLSQVRQRQGRPVEAAAALDRAIERKPDRPELFRARASMAVDLDGQGQDGTRDLTPSRRAAALRDLEQAIRLEKNNSFEKAQDHTRRGQLLLAGGQTEAALAAYDTALQIVPNDSRTLQFRAFALLDLKRYDKVLVACDQALATGQPSANLLEARGLARMERKDIAGAISDYTVALSLAPDSAPLHNHRGWAYLFTDSFRLALADFDAALRVDSGLVEAYSGRGLARISLGQWREALADAENAVRLATAEKKQRALYNAARVHAHARRFAADEVTRRGETALALWRRLHGRAAEMLLESARLLPPDRRAPFWRDVVASDPALKPYVPGPG